MLTAEASQTGLFLLSGETSTLPFGELKALIETYSEGAEVEAEGSRIVLAKGHLNPTIIAKRAAYTRLGGANLGSIDLSEWVKGIRRVDFTPLSRFRSFAVEVHNFTDQELSGDIAAYIGSVVKGRLPSIRVSLSSPEVLIAAVVYGGVMHICAAEPASTEKSWRPRRPRARPFFHPSALYPKFARSLVNLARVREGEVILDPFCGTGGVLIEAGLMGVKALGVDISRRMCRGGLKNLSFFQVESAGVVSGDARCLPVSSVDGVATDIPYGRCSSTYRVDLEEMLLDFFGELEYILPSGRCACVVHPDSVKLPLRRGFRQIEEHRFYIHRALTRAVTVLRRI